MRLPGNQWKLQRVAAPGQEIVRRIIPVKTTKCCTLTFLHGLSKQDITCLSVDFKEAVVFPSPISYLCAKLSQFNPGNSLYIYMEQIWVWYRSCHLILGKKVNNCVSLNISFHPTPGTDIYIFRWNLATTIILKTQPESHSSGIGLHNLVMYGWSFPGLLIREHTAKTLYPGFINSTHPRTITNLHLPPAAHHFHILQIYIPLCSKFPHLLHSDSKPLWTEIDGRLFPCGPDVALALLHPRHMLFSLLFQT